MKKKIYIAITIDTEEDLWDAYQQLDNPVENTYAIPRLQELFDRYGVIPTYFVNYPVVADDKAVDILGRIHRDGRCEIGTHCHPWNTPPFMKDGQLCNTMLSNLIYEAILSKIITVHDLIKERFGEEPKSFRAGRFGFNDDVARALGVLGYEVDSSMTPFYDWRPIGGPDFRHVRPHPFRLSSGHRTSKGQDITLIEAPVTTGFFKGADWLNSRLHKILTTGRGRMKRLVWRAFERAGILNFRWLSPEESSADDMVRLVTRLMTKGECFFTMLFHSNSLIPTRRGYMRTQTDVEHFYGRLEGFLEKITDVADVEYVPVKRVKESSDDL